MQLSNGCRSSLKAEWVGLNVCPDSTTPEARAPLHVALHPRPLLQCSLAGWFNPRFTLVLERALTTWQFASLYLQVFFSAVCHFQSFLLHVCLRSGTLSPSFYRVQPSHPARCGWGLHTQRSKADAQKRPDTDIFWKSIYIVCCFFRKIPLLQPF